jgi:hypothetical protein
VLVVAVIMMIIMFAFLAFAVDIGYILTTQAQAQRAADAAALAGAIELASQDRLTQDSILDLYDAARDSAVEFAGLNRVAGDGATINRNGWNLPVGDVVIGRLDDTTDRSVQLTFADWEHYNAVQVRIRRTQSSEDGRVPLYFSRLLGVDSASVVAEAIAVLQFGMDGFRATEETGNVGALPFALDLNIWNDLLAGNGPDNYEYDEETDSIWSGHDGLLEIVMYPGGGGGNGNGNGSHTTPGNFGTIDIGSSGNSTNDLVRQINEGISPDDLAHHGGELALDPLTESMTLNGDTGLSAGLEDALVGVMGAPRIIMLYDSVTGQGNNAQYNIVGFAGVRIVDVNLRGRDKGIVIQPAIVTDPAIIVNETSTSSFYISGPPRLAR